MNSALHSRQILGYPQLLTLIGGYAQSTAGRRRVEALCPHNQLAEIQAKRGLYEDLLKLQERTEVLPRLGVEELDELLLRVQPADAILDGLELRQCLSQLNVAGEINKFIQLTEIKEFKSLFNLACQVASCESLRQALLRSIDVDGTVLDSASERLRELRRSRAETERRLQRILEELVKTDAASSLQEKFVTQRNGRYVVPVKRDAQKSLPGLVHDVSSTGQTLFVEPAQTLPLGNALATLAAEEREEVRRILARLSDGVRSNLEAFRTNQRVLSELDAAAAVARWGADYGCVLPSFGGFLKLSGARHPLLLAQFRHEGAGRKVVPLCLDLPPRTKTLAITGSNTGGKTVALKTIGLIVLAAQSGLPVPVAPDSLFEIYDNVLADIGDEQSLAENLSTFSGHLANIADILRVTRQGKSLALLDELGSGTDPLEGGAIACGVLAELASRRTLTVVTTHLGGVKNFVHATPGMVNAAVRFNVETLQPEYTLDIGRPGASHGLAIARRMGLPAGVLKRAEGFLSGDHRQLEEVLEKMDRDQRKLSASADAAEHARVQAETERDELKKQLDDLRVKRRELMKDAYERADAMVDNTRRTLENLVRDIREKAKANPSGGANAVSDAVVKARATLAEKQTKLQQGLRQTSVSQLGRPLEARKMEPGKRIWVERLGAHGRIRSVDSNGKRLVVEVNGMPFTLKTGEVFPEQYPEEAPKATTVAVNMPRFEGQTSHEIVLVGMRVDEAIGQLARYLNDCVMAGLDEVRVVHGFGSGRLRDGLQQWLRTQPYVVSFRTGIDQRDTGGGGVTLVRLK
ncbi:MAG: Smr/MutS family protein [Victivallales bacterium]|nr:Smr/MutS family protein [Victivallales bacterium]